MSYKIRKMQEKARYAVVKITWKYEFEVELNEIKVGVELDKKVCGCGYWQLMGIPCAHALAFLNTVRITNIKDYIDLPLLSHRGMEEVLSTQFPLKTYGLACQRLTCLSHLKSEGCQGGLQRRGERMMLKNNLHQGEL